jgi:hypothetical protein
MVEVSREFINYISDVTEEELEQFDKTTLLFQTNKDKDDEDLVLLARVGTDEYFNQAVENKDKSPKDLKSIKQVAEMISTNFKQFVKSTSVMVAGPGDRTITLASAKEG